VWRKATILRKNQKMRPITLSLALLALPAVAIAQITPPAIVAPPTATVAPTLQPGTPPSAATEAALRGGLRMSKIIGSNVHNEADEDVGKVDEIILPTGGAPTAILAVGGFLGIGSHYVAVPLSRLRMGPRDRWVMQGATKEYLRTLPPFTYTAAAQR
jgi:hypothetical protein